MKRIVVPLAFLLFLPLIGLALPFFFRTSIAAQAAQVHLWQLARYPIYGILF